MSKLTSAERKALPASEFAGPGRSYPIPDRSHAVNAEARAAQQVKKGNLSPQAEATIVRKAKSKLRDVR